MQKYSSSDAGLLLIRLVLAAVFVYHGAGKLFGVFGGGGIEATAQYFESIGLPWPTLSAIVQGCLEFFGGIMLGAGIFARLVAIPLSFSMFVAVAVAHWGKFDVRQGGMEYALTLAVVLLGIVLIGPGRMSLISWPFKKRAA